MKEDSEENKTVAVTIGIHEEGDGNRRIGLYTIENMMIIHGISMSPDRARLYGEMLINCADVIEAAWEKKDD